MDNISFEKHHELVKIAKEASLKAYSPYSLFKVGAALLGASGRIYTGCNVENASYSMSICAERNALFHAVAEGETKYTAIAIYVDSDYVFSPCGACRQVLAEFSEDMPIIISNREKTYSTTLDKLLPDKFSLENA